jgi:hypothetical protein
MDRVVSVMISVLKKDSNIIKQVLSFKALPAINQFTTIYMTYYTYMIDCNRYPHIYLGYLITVVKLDN